MTAMPALSVSGLSKNFGALAVAQAIDLDLAAGARVALIGPNGAGKTTFVNLLTGFLEPDGGTIALAGESLAGMRPEQRVKRGLVRTHQISTLLLDNSARDNVAIAIAEREGFAWRAATRRSKSSKRWGSPALRTEASRSFLTASSGCSKSPSRCLCGPEYCCSMSRPPAYRRTKPN